MWYRVIPPSSPLLDSVDKARTFGRDTFRLFLIVDAGGAACIYSEAMFSRRWMGDAGAVGAAASRCQPSSAAPEVTAIGWGAKFFRKQRECHGGDRRVIWENCQWQRPTSIVKCDIKIRRCLSHVPLSCRESEKKKHFSKRISDEI